jgi:hypothetical protein
LFAEYGATTTTAVVYGLNMISVFGIGWAIFSYATGHRRLVAADLDRDLVRGGILMGVAYMAFMITSLAVSFISPVASFALYGVMVVTIIVTTIVGRGEVVLLWRSGRGTVPRGKKSVPLGPRGRR